MIRHAESFLSSSCRLDLQSFASSVNLRDRALCDLEPVLPNAIYFLRSLLSAFLGVVHYHLGAFLHPVKGVLRARGASIRPLDGGPFSEGKRMLRSVCRLNDDRLRRGVNFRNFSRPPPHPAPPSNTGSP